MKKASTLFLIAISALCAQAQQHSLTIEISRSDYSEIQVVDENEKYILAEIGEAIKTSQNAFSIIEGKGGEKDSNGIKERKKDYLTDNKGDTLATIINSLNMMIIENQTIHFEKNLSTWTYSLDSSDEALAELNLMWNKQKWRYQMQFSQDNALSDVLKKYLLLTMVDTAKKESATDCDDGMETFWMILYMSSLAQ